MKKIAIYSLLCFVLFSSSCKKDKPGTADDEQGDYFTCYVNGEFWEAYSDAQSSQENPDIYAQFNVTDGYLNLQVLKNTGVLVQEIKMYVHEIDKPGSFEMATGNGHLKLFYDYSSSDCNSYFADTLNPGSFNLTYWNQQEHHMKGTFSMTLRNPDCPDSLLYITNGKFSFFYY